MEDRPYGYGGCWLCANRISPGSTLEDVMRNPSICSLTGHETGNGPCEEGWEWYVGEDNRRRPPMVPHVGLLPEHAKLRLEEDYPNYREHLEERT